MISQRLSGSERIVTLSRRRFERWPAQPVGASTSTATLAFTIPTFGLSAWQVSATSRWFCCPYAPQLGKNTAISVDSYPKFLGRDSTSNLSGSAGVLAYFSFACSLFRTTLWLLVQLVGLPLFSIGFGPFLSHANSLPQAGLDS